VGDLLAARDIPHAVIDMDWLRWCSPSSDDDPFHARLGMRNLEAIWSNYAAAGIQRLIIADVIESPRQRAEYAAAVPGAIITIVRLHAAIATIHARLRGRESGSSLEWHLNRAVVLTEQMERDALEDVRIETDALDAVAVAGLALEHWKRHVG
jgi:hypothetical protein